MSIIKCLPCEIYRSGMGDCSNGGISARFREVLVPIECGYVEVDTENPPENLVKFEKKDFGFAVAKRFFPYDTGGKWYMMGGTFVYSCDSRFRDKYGDYPLPLMDRTE